MPDMDKERKGLVAPGCGDAKQGEGPGPVLDSQALLGGRPEVLIRHEGRLYRLRRTRLGKLILTA
jgi:hemin uptake protein HemP